jgi:hypothetical protein
MLLLIVSILAACANQPQTDPPDWNIDTSNRTEIKDATPLPLLCAIPWPADSLACWEALDAFDIVTERNHDVLQATSNALRNERAAGDAFIQAGKNQQEITQFYLDELRAEESAHRIDNWLHKGFIGLLALVALAL